MKNVDIRNLIAEEPIRSWCETKQMMLRDNQLRFSFLFALKHWNGFFSFDWRNCITELISTKSLAQTVFFGLGWGPHTWAFCFCFRYTPILGSLRIGCDLTGDPMATQVSLFVCLFFAFNYKLVKALLIFNKGH